jgi:hypothetical protein
MGFPLKGVFIDARSAQSPLSSNMGDRVQVALLRRLYIRNATISADSLSHDNSYNPVIDGQTFACNGTATCCSLAKDCAVLGIDVRFDAVGPSGAGGPYATGVDDSLEAASQRRSSCFNPRFGLPHNASSRDEWL